MIISDRRQNKDKPVIHSTDLINIEKFNKLPSPVIAQFASGDQFWIETLDVQTGLMRVDVSGQIDQRWFSEVMLLIDMDGNEHDPDWFWVDYEEDTDQ